GWSRSAAAADACPPSALDGDGSAPNGQASASATTVIMGARKRDLGKRSIDVLLGQKALTPTLSQREREIPSARRSLGRRTPGEWPRHHPDVQDGRRAGPAGRSSATPPRRSG